MQVEDEDGKVSSPLRRDPSPLPSPQRGEETGEGVKLMLCGYQRGALKAVDNRGSL